MTNHYTHAKERNDSVSETMEDRRQWNDIFNLCFMRNSTIFQCGK